MSRRLESLTRLRLTNNAVVREIGGYFELDPGGGNTPLWYNTFCEANQRR